MAGGSTEDELLRQQREHKQRTAAGQRHRLLTHTRSHPSHQRGCHHQSSTQRTANRKQKADCFAWGLSYCDPELLAWPARWARVRACLEAADADVVCLQEVGAPE